MPLTPEELKQIKVNATFSDFDSLVYELVEMELKGSVRNPLKSITEKHPLFPRFSQEQILDILLWCGDSQTKTVLKFRKLLIQRIAEAIEKIPMTSKSREPVDVFERRVGIIITSLRNFLENNTYFENSDFREIRRQFTGSSAMEHLNIITTIQHVLEKYTQAYINMRAKKHIHIEVAKQEVENILELVFNWKLISSEIYREKQ